MNSSRSAKSDNIEVQSLLGIAAAFTFAHDLFRLPSAEQYAWLTSQQWRSSWRAISAAIGEKDPSPPDLPLSASEYESLFLSAYEVGAPNPPIPLIESHYNKLDPVPRILHENILFYRAFGLQLKEESFESADHLRYQLEFLAHLFRAEAATSGTDRLEQIRTARHDYLDRHPGIWLPQALENAQGAPDWIRRFVEITLGLITLAGTKAEL